MNSTLYSNRVWFVLFFVVCPEIYVELEIEIMNILSCFERNIFQKHCPFLLYKTLNIYL